MIVLLASASSAAAVIADRRADCGVLHHALAVASLSLTAADVELVQVGDVDREHLVGERAVARGGPDRDIAAGVRLAVDGPGHGDDARVGIDGEPSAVVVLQAVGDRVVRGIGVAGAGRDAHRRADDRVLVHRIGRGVTVGDRPDVELVQVVDVDRKHLVGERTVARGGPDRDVPTGAVRLAIDRPGHGHDARVGVDGEPAAVVVLQAVGDRVVRGIRVAGRRGHADRGADDRVLVDRIGRGIRVADRTHVELIHVVDRDRKHRVVVEVSLEVARTVMS